MEVGLSKGADIDIIEMDEGKEKTEFWRAMNVHIGDRTQYHCLLDSKLSSYKCLSDDHIFITLASL